MRHRGTPVYTQNSVAFPNLPLDNPWYTDKISISFEAKGGGTYGECRLTCMSFNSLKGSASVELAIFEDGMSILQDERMLLLIKKLKNREHTSPDELVKLIESVGIQPSAYQKEGLCAKQ